MEIIKRKILLEKSVERKQYSKNIIKGESNYGNLKNRFFYLNIFITQNIDDMGIFTDTNFIENERGNGGVDYSILAKKVYNSGYSYPFMNNIKPLPISEDKENLRLINVKKENYYNYGNLKITGTTESKYEDLRGYNISNPFMIDFNIKEEIYLNYKGEVIVGRDTILSNNEPRIYVIDSEKNKNNSGIKYIDYEDDVTNFEFTSEGINETNISISALTKEEYLFGIISTPEVKSDVFIERGYTSVMDKHLRLSEINTLAEMEKYGNGFYKLNK